MSGFLRVWQRPAAPSLAQLESPILACGQVVWLGDIRQRDLSESSGLTASPQHAGVLWSVNDSGNEPILYALRLDGTHVGAWRVAVDAAVDWESMDAFVYEGRSYLAIGDTGDNFRWRRRVRILVVEEPAILTSAEAPLPIAWQIEYRYPHGYRDSEAMAVDAANRSVYVVSKRHYPPELFRLPLKAEGLVAAEHVRDLIEFPLPTPAEIVEDDGQAHRYMPVGMDLAGDKLLIATYKDVFIYDMTKLGQAPARVPMPSIGQREAVTFLAGSEEQAVVSRERYAGVGVADLFLLQLKCPSE